MLMDIEKKPPASKHPLRIGIVTEFSQRIGGTETYLSTTIPELINHGHQVAVFVGNSNAVNNDTITRLAPTFRFLHAMSKDKTKRCES